MDCDRVKDLYKTVCENAIPNIYFRTFTEEENKKIQACADSIKLYEEFCLSKKTSEKEEQNEKQENNRKKNN
jgi:hypothetical protein